MNPLHAYIDLGNKKALLEALAEMSADELTELLNKPSADQKQQTVLHRVVDAGWYDVIPALVRAGANPAIKNFYEEDALFTAVSKNNIEAATALLQAGAKATSRKFDDQKTALQWAIENKNVPMVQLLLDYGADVAARTPPTENGLNAYHYAASSTPEIMDILLRQKGAEAVHEAASDDGKSTSVLRIALARGDRVMVEKLLDYGVNVNAVDDHGETPLFHLLANRSSREDAVPLIRLLIQRGADIDKLKNYWDETPLFPAVRASFTEAVGMLLDIGLSATQVNHFKETALHQAAKNWDAKIVRDLISHGAEVDALNKQKRTPLHVAAHANRLDVVKALLQAGADPFAKDERGRTPADLAPAPFQQRVKYVLEQRQRELEIKKYGYDMYWNRKAKEPVPAAKSRGRFRRDKHPSQRFPNRR